MSTGTATTWSELVAARLADNTDPAVVAGAVSWSGQELLERAQGALDLLDDWGVPAGDVVPALVSTSPAAIAVAIAAAASGRPLAPFSPRQTVSELAACVQRLTPSVILADATSRNLAQELAQASKARVAMLDDVARGSRTLPIASDPARTAFVIHTSGTTGIPKRVDYRQGLLVKRSRVFATLLDLGSGDRYVTASPFHHVSGLGTCAAILGAGAAVVSIPRFDLEHWEALHDAGVTHATAVPTALHRLIEADALDIPTLRVLQYGGSPVSLQLLERLQRARPDLTLVQFFGQTEGTPLTWLNAADHRLGRTERPALLQSAGRAVPGVEVRVAHPDGTGEGEVLARGAHLAGAESGTWLATGDRGRLDADGYLYLSGRASDRIIRGGENIYPSEIEQVLEQHPAVREAAVVGVPDQDLGERVVAFVVAGAEGPVPDEQLRTFTRSHLSGFKVPAEWVWIEELPRNPVGKLVRRALLPPGSPSLS